MPEPSPRKKKSTNDKDETPGDQTFTGGGETEDNLKEEEKKEEGKEGKEGKEEHPKAEQDTKKDDKQRGNLLNLVHDLFLLKYSKEYYPFKFRTIIRVLIQVKELFKKEPVLVECKLPVVIVGDIHGQFPDLQRVFTIFSDKGRLGCFNQRYIFLGDYIDRGKQSLECIMLVFILKILFPLEFILLRGNHEMRPINMAYGFLNELEERFERKEARTLFVYFNEVFTFMPLCCIAGDNILCMHGGICPEMTSREVFKTPLIASNDHIVAESLLWADPMYGEPRARPNRIRGLGVHFGEPMVDEICEKLGVKMIVRGHQMMMNGFKFFHGHKLVTVFTASHYYPDKLNHGAVLVAEATGRCGFRIIAPAKSAEDKVFRGEHEIANAHDNGYQTHPDVLRAQMMLRVQQEAEMRAELRKNGATVKRRSPKH